MEIRIFDRTLRLCGIADRIDALTATECFDDAGAFSLAAPLGEAKRFAVEQLLLIPGVGDGFVVERIREDLAAGTVTVSGRGALSYFARCAIPETIVCAGGAEALLCFLAEEYGAEALPGPLALETCGRTETVDAAPGRIQLLSAMRRLCAEAGVGMRLRLDGAERRFVFSVRGRTPGAAFLSRSLGNLTGGVRETDRRRYANRVIVAGNGGCVVTLDAAGLFDDGTDDAAETRRTLFEDATDLALSRYESEARYREALAARGRRILAERRPLRSASFDVPEETAKSLSPGDVCPVADGTLGVRGEALCAARTLTWRAGRRHWSVQMEHRE